MSSSRRATLAEKPKNTAQRSVSSSMRAERLSERAKQKATAAVSHELRTPMNGMAGSIQMLGSTDLSSDQVQYHEVLTSSAQNLSNLLDDLFDLTRIEVGMMHRADPHQPTPAARPRGQSGAAEQPQTVRCASV